MAIIGGILPNIGNFAENQLAMKTTSVALGDFSPEEHLKELKAACHDRERSIYE